MPQRFGGNLHLRAVDRYLRGLCDRLRKKWIARKMLGARDDGRTIYSGNRPVEFNAETSAMPDTPANPSPDRNDEPRQEKQGGGGAGAAVAPPKRKDKTKPKPPQPLPPWKVMLHNDDENDVHYVVRTVMELTTLNEQDATLRTVEAHEEGVSLLVTTHRERAELYKEQFESKGLTVTIEPAD